MTPALRPEVGRSTCQLLPLQLYAALHPAVREHRRWSSMLLVVPAAAAHVGQLRHCQGILGDVTMTAKLCTQLLKLHVILRELASKWLDEVEEVMRLNAAGTQQLQSASLVALWSFLLGDVVARFSADSKQRGI